MTRRKLAAALRKFQNTLGVSKDELRVTPDDEVIRRSITCEDCGTQAVPDEMVDELIRSASTLRDFFGLLMEASGNMVLEHEASHEAEEYFEDEIEPAAVLQMPKRDKRK